MPLVFSPLFILFAMKTLIVYYSRTGTTRKIAQTLADKLNCDQEQIIDTVQREGAIGYLISGRDATTGRLTKLEDPQHDPSNYDLVIVGTPIWSWNVSVPVRTYLTDQAGKLKKAAFFCVMGGSGNERAFRTMSDICHCQPSATLALTAKEVIQEQFQDQLESFISKLPAD